jgi:hypothetical protein
MKCHSLLAAVACLCNITLAAGPELVSSQKKESALPPTKEAITIVLLMKFN